MLRDDGDGLHILVRSETEETRCAPKPSHQLAFILEHNGATPWFIQKKRAQGVTHAQLVL